MGTNHAPNHKGSQCPRSRLQYHAERLETLLMDTTQVCFDDPNREDRLRRNRQSAKKCRLKRKASMETMQQTVSHLTAENALLLQENEKLKAMLARAQASEPSSPLDDCFEQSSFKRARHEKG